MRKGKHTVIIAVALIVTMISGILMITALAENPEFTIVPGSKIADPNTSRQDGFSNVPLLHDGRIWTDKSVDVGPGTDDFIITLSALSQSFNVTSGYAIPADTVFIIDVSGSMVDDENNIGGRRRIEVLIDALNETIGMLLDANPDNRIAVVAYGGRAGGFARVEHVLPLGRPTIASGDASFFTYSSAGGHFVLVHAENRSVDRVLVQGSTPTQWGIYEGTRILSELNRSDTIITVPVLDSFGNEIGTETVTRRPNIILMTDGEPTMSWHDYAFTSATTGMLSPGPTGIQLIGDNFYGDGSYGEMGVSLLTVLTAAHRKALVHGRYFPAGWNNAPASTNQPTAYVGFYTISITNEQTEEALALINATMDPGNFAGRLGPTLVGGITGIQNPAAPNGSSPTDANMGALLSAFEGGSAISFHAQQRISYPLGYTWAEATGISNTIPLDSNNLDFATRYFPVEDAQELRDAFESIKISMQTKSLTNVTAAEPDRTEFEGYIVFSDVLGQYMEFRGITEVSFNNTAYSRAGIGTAIADNTGTRNAIEGVLYEHLNFGVTSDNPRYISRNVVGDLLISNLACLRANDSIKYYARTNRDFVGSYFNADGSNAPRPAGAEAVVEVFPMWGILSDPLPPGAGRRHNNLMHIAFHVITALDNNTNFEEINDGGVYRRIMNADDQMIRWYIPASLIPQRRVDPNTGQLDPDFNIHPIRVRYRVGLNEERVAAGISWGHFNYNRSSAGGENPTYFYTNRNQADRQNVTLAFYEPHHDNPFYDTRETDSSRGIAKTANVTGTAPHVMVHHHTVSNHTRTGWEQRLDEHWLGNNGRLTVRLVNPPTGPPTDPPTYPPTDPPTYPPTDPPTYPPTYPPTDPPTYPPTDPPTYPPTDPPTYPPTYPPPADSPPSPQTGVTSHLTIHLIVIALGAVLLIGAEVFRRKHKAKNKE